MKLAPEMPDIMFKFSVDNATQDMFTHMLNNMSRAKLVTEPLRLAADKIANAVTVSSPKEPDLDTIDQVAEHLEKLEELLGADFKNFLELYLEHKKEETDPIALEVQLVSGAPVDILAWTVGELRQREDQIKELFGQAPDNTEWLQVEFHPQGTYNKLDTVDTLTGTRKLPAYLPATICAQLQQADTMTVAYGGSPIELRWRAGYKQ